MKVLKKIKTMKKIELEKLKSKLVTLKEEKKESRGKSKNKIKKIEYAIKLEEIIESKLFKQIVKVKSNK